MYCYPLSLFLVAVHAFGCGGSAAPSSPFPMQDGVRGATRQVGRPSRARATAAHNPVSG